MVPIDAQRGSWEEVGHSYRCYSGLNLWARQTFLIVSGLHVCTQRSQMWMASVAMVPDVSSGLLLASKPCRCCPCWEQVPLVSLATRASHLHGN